ncbi:hypothetical protein L1049_028585 [Liquidambar formosana]|uniref:Uncharacterized protein n=1 Tax=Liquidambar formosana TaxID=63359 RepID=A0AAP0RKF7_LIQFO
MAPHTTDDDEEEFSGGSSSDNDDGFDEDMEALRRACMLTGSNPSDLNPSSSSAAAATTTTTTTASASDSDGGDSSDFDDLELVRNIQKRFSISDDFDQPLSLKPLNSLPPGLSDDEEDDFETLRAIQRRFTAYGSDPLKNSPEHCVQKPEQVRASSITSEKETSIDLFENRTNACEGFPDSEGVCDTTLNLDSLYDIVPGIQPSGFIEWHQSDVQKLSTLPLNYSSFPKSAQAFIDAIKKNRSCQKFLRNKLIQIEARIEENRKLKERVKILKDFQISCRKRTGRALSQKKDPRVQLISAPKLGASKDSKDNDKKASAMYNGPTENSHVAHYRMALTKFPLSLHRQKWSKAENENLGKGIRQEFQKALLEKSVDLFSGSEGSSGDSNDIDNIISSIKDLEITPESIRLFLPKVDWKKFASIYIKGRSGAECEARWLNFEDPLINHNPWTKMEDKNLLFIVQQRGINNWIDISVSLGSNRTPFQCLARYQRSLNASILKSEWTDDEDNQLRTAVEAFGEGNWQLIASNLEGRTGTQCSNRWKKTLHPARQRVGRWTLDEDKRLKVAVTFFGPKTWKKIAEFVPGRTQVQCRERWVNSLDPSLNWDEWTEEEDSRLKAAIVEHGYCWSKVATCVAPRTDSQCLRRWKVLLPHEVPLLQASRKIQKAALISNFVDRESERPALGPKDFFPLPAIGSVSEPENGNPSRKQKRNPRKRPESKKTDAAFCNVTKNIGSKRLRKNAQNCSKEAPGITHTDEIETLGNHDGLLKNGLMKPFSKRKKCTDRVQEHSSPDMDLSLAMIGNSEGVAACGGSDTTKNRKSPKPRSKRSKCTEPAESQGLPPLAPQSLELKTTNGDGADTLCGNNNTKTKKKRVSKQHDSTKTKNSRESHSNGNKCSEAGENHSFLSFPPQSLELGMADGCVETLGGNSTAIESGKHQNSTLSSGNTMLIETTNGSEFRPDHSSFCPDSTLLMITNGEEGGTFGVNNTAMKKKAPKPRPKRKKSTEPANDSCSLSSGPESLELRITNDNGTLNFPGDNTASDKNKRPLKHKYTEPSEECQEFASVSQEDRPKKSRTRDEFCSTPISDRTDEDDTTIACILHNKLNKKRPERAKNANQACSLSEECQDFESVICQEDRTKKSRTRDESCSTQISGRTDEDDTTLACIVHDKLNKRRLERAKSGNQACSLSEDCQDFASVCQEDRSKYSSGEKSCSQISGTEEDDITLACILRGELKKRRRNHKGSELLSRVVCQP